MIEAPKIDAKKALKLRRRVKASKPSFNRPESWRYVRLKESWRRPRGLDHKMRRKKKGWPATVSTGYRGPKIARDLHPSGYREALVFTVEDLGEVDPKTHAIRIGHTVGGRKRVRIITEARRREFLILNVRKVKEAPEEKESLEEESAEQEEKEETKTVEKEPLPEKEMDKSKKPARRTRKARKEKEPAKSND
jgi:large subunit ribosomal protein L32e